MENDLNELFQTNVVGNIRLFNAFLPLIKKGELKKVVTLGSGLTDEDPVLKYEIVYGPSYSVTKTAMNMVNTKFQAEYKKEGIIFMSVSPGSVDTGHNDHLSPEDQQRAMVMAMQLRSYAPHFTELIKAADAARMVLDVVDKATMEVNGGRLVSHFGNKQWL
jgi:NAD(P)-dependent dehydrogenase (short-subunit alcohol dehydrogenase family)